MSVSTSADAALSNGADYETPRRVLVVVNKAAMTELLLSTALISLCAVVPDSYEEFQCWWVYGIGVKLSR